MRGGLLRLRGGPHLFLCGCRLCGVARHDAVHDRRDLHERRRVGGVVTLGLKVHFGVKLVLHGGEFLPCRRIFAARHEPQHEIARRAYEQPQTQHDAYFRRPHCAQSPEREQRREHERDRDEHVGTHGIGTLDLLVEHGGFRHYLAGIAETHAEIAHPCVAHDRRCLRPETRGGELRDVVVVDDVLVFQIRQHLSGGTLHLIRLGGEKGEPDDYCNAPQRHRNHDIERIDSDSRELFRQTDQPVEYSVEKVHLAADASVYSTTNVMVIIPHAR